MEAPGDVETADQVDIEWTDYEKRRYNKYKAHDAPASPALWGLDLGPAAAVPRSSMHLTILFFEMFRVGTLWAFGYNI